MGFTPMTREQRKISDRERDNATCIRMNEGGCTGKMDVSHPFGRKVQERWMWIWCCHEHHEGKRKNEEIGRLHCYQQTTEEEIKATFPKTYQIYLNDKKWLEKKYKHLLWITQH